MAMIMFLFAVAITEATNVHVVHGQGSGGKNPDPNFVPCSVGPFGWLKMVGDVGDLGVGMFCWKS